MMEPFFGERIWDLSFCADKIIFVKFLFNEYFLFIGLLCEIEAK